MADQRLVLYCQYCGLPQTLTGLEILPCAKCGSHKMATDAPTPKERTYVLTVNDRRFLRSLRIQADD